MSMANVGGADRAIRHHYRHHPDRRTLLPLSRYLGKPDDTYRDSDYRRRVADHRA